MEFLVISILTRDNMTSKKMPSNWDLPYGLGEDEKLNDYK